MKGCVQVESKEAAAASIKRFHEMLSGKLYGNGADYPNYARELQAHCVVRPQRVPKPAPLGRWPQTNIAGRLDQVRIMPAHLEKIEEQQVIAA
jgi:hypothetical protein